MPVKEIEIGKPNWGTDVNENFATLQNEKTDIPEAFTEGNLASLDENGNLQDSGQSAQSLTEGGRSIVPCTSEYNDVEKVHVLTPVYENQSIPTSGIIPVTFIPDADFHAGDKLRFNGQDCDAAYSNTDLAVADGAFRAGFVTSVIFQFMETGGGTDRTCLAILHNGEALYASNAGKLNGLVPEAYIQPQENLFINWNLKNPVNQQNKTNYTESGYCIDMWIGGLASEATTGYSLNVTPDGLVLLPLHYVLQYFEQVTWEGELVTFALLMDGILYTVSWKWNKDAEYELIANFKGLLIWYSGKYKYIQLLSTAASNLILQAAKAEKGSIFTGWPVWNYALELAKCQRYALEMVSASNNEHGKVGIGNVLNEITAVIFCPTPVSLRTTPSASFAGNFRLVESGRWEDGIPVTSINANHVTTNGISLYVNTTGGLHVGKCYELVFNSSERNSLLLNANL